MIRLLVALLLSGLGLLNTSNGVSAWTRGEAGSLFLPVADRGVVKVGDEAPNFQLRPVRLLGVSVHNLVDPSEPSAGTALPFTEGV